MLYFDKCQKLEKLPKTEGLTFSVVKNMPELSALNTPQHTLLPGFCDVHVHFREPGFSYKETIRSGCRAAAHGGYTAVCTMPNLSPVPDSLDHLATQMYLIQKDAIISVYPYGSISVGEEGKQLAAFDELAPKVVAFSDDGKGLQDDDLMREAMYRAKTLGKMIVAHCEINSLLNNGYIHEGKYALNHGHRGICSESEWGQIARDLRLVKETGCRYHICHVSTKEGVELIRQAKAEGLDVTCETAPHYLLLDENDLEENGRYKMNPPLRASADREALLAGILDGTIDMIATDHAPHSVAEKSRGLEKSAFGIVGLETAFSVLYTGLVRSGIISLNKLMDLLVYSPRRRFEIPLANDFSVWNLDEEYEIEPEQFFSMGRATPFANRKVYGKCLLTVKTGQPVFIA